MAEKRSEAKATGTTKGPKHAAKETARLKPVWKARFRVLSYDIDFRSRLRISNLCGFFQDIAGGHAEHLGVGYQHMLESGRVWVLSRLYIKIHAYPKWEDELKVETWPTGMERLFFRREFEVFRDRQKMISASSYWLALDTGTMRPQLFPIDEDVISRNAGHHALDEGMESIPSPAGAHQVTSTREVRYSEIDQNLHMNNTRYIEWIMDQFDISHLETSMPHFLAIEFRHEVKAQDVVHIRKTTDPQNANVFLMEGILDTSNQVCFRAKVMF